MNFVVRCFTSIFPILLIASVLLWMPKWVFSFGTAVFSALGLYEFLTMLKDRGVAVNRVFGVFIGFILPLVVHFHFGLTFSGEVLFIVLSCFCLFLIHFCRDDKTTSLEGIALTFFGIMYIAWFLSFIIKIHFLKDGAFFIAYLFLVTKSADIAAYVVGSRIGKHSFAPDISPKKSVEGTIAGVLASGLVSLFFTSVFPIELHYSVLLMLGCAIGVIGQFGDLSESLIKRYCGVKDSGKIFPGMGGMLDLMDSVLFTTPLFYFFLKTISPEI